MEGTLPLSAIGLDREATPDLVVSYRWTDTVNEFGLPGEFIGDGSTKGPKGSHASLSRYDMHNTLVAAGPDFKKGWRDSLPSGNADIAPTILTLLGQPVPKTMEGRVLTESLTAKHEAPRPHPRKSRRRPKSSVMAGGHSTCKSAMSARLFISMKPTGPSAHQALNSPWEPE
ncbi:MAG: hypothetical protein QM796_06400 [Chthoniobacteraceae bacterium]